jgi:hypothetical protein
MCRDERRAVFHGYYASDWVEYRQTKNSEEEGLHGRREIESIEVQDDVLRNEPYTPSLSERSITEQERVLYNPRPRRYSSI